MKWFKLDLTENDGDFVTSIKIDGQKLCLVKYQAKVYVMQNTCPHAGGSLSGGWCRNGNIVCPIHRYQYNLLSGKGLPGQRDFITVYPVEEREDGTYVGMKEGIWKSFFSK